MNNSNFQDWSVLCRCSSVGRGISSGPQAEFAGYLHILSQKYLPSSCGSEYIIHYTHATVSGQSTGLLSTELRDLGQLALVFELGRQPHLCSPGDFAEAVGPPLCQYHAASAVQSSQASADPCILC